MADTSIKFHAAFAKFGVGISRRTTIPGVCELNLDSPSRNQSVHSGSFLSLCLESESLKGQLVVDG